MGEVAEMICSACKEDVHPVIAFAAPSGERGGGKMEKCPRCGAGMSTRQSVAVLPQQLQGVAAVEDAQVEPGPRLPPKLVARAPAPTDILEMARDRLTFVRERISELRQFEAEEARLVRMVAAAEEPVLRAV